MENSALGNLGKRVIAWIVLAAAAVLLLKIVFGAVVGFVTMMFTLAAIAAAVVAIVWAVRHL